MGRPLDAYDNIAIASIVIYSFFLVGGVLLCVKHGFLRSSAWRFLIIFTLARLVGSALRLASVSDPTNENLYIGWMVLNGLGLGPLILVLFGLLGRMFDSMARQGGRVVVNLLFQHAITVLMLVAVILIIIGGVNSTYIVDAGEPKIDYVGTSQAGTGLFVAVFAILCLEVLLALRKRHSVSAGERRILLGVIIALPFLLVRLLFSCIVVFGGITASCWLYLGMLVIMEIFVVFISEVIGFSVGRVEPAPRAVREGQLEEQSDRVEPRNELEHGNMDSKT